MKMEGVCGRVRDVFAVPSRGSISKNMADPVPKSSGSATALWGVDKLRGSAVGLRYDVISGASEGSGDSVSSPRPQTDHFAR